MSTTTKPSYGQPALIGGVVMGVLSALPLVNVFNVCCCGWVICGGVVAAYLLQQNSAEAITPPETTHRQQQALPTLITGSADRTPATAPPINAACR